MISSSSSAEFTPMFARLFSVGVIALAFAGCGPAKLDVTKTYNVGGETPAQAIELTAQSQPQTINVEFSSTTREVTVMVVKMDDAKTVDDLFGSEKKAIAFKKAKSDSFTAEVPANTPVWVGVVAGPGDKTDVTLKVTNKK